MKLSKREKMLLIVLGLLLLSVGYYQLVFIPQLEKIDELNAKVEELETLSSITKAQSSNKNNVYREFKVLNSKIYLITERFYPSIIQEKLILRLDEIIKETEINVKTMSFTYPEKAFVEKVEDKDAEVDMLKEYVQTYQMLSQSVSPLNLGKPAEEEVIEEETEEDGLKEKVEKMTASLTFEGDYEQLMDFMGEIEALNKYVIIDKLNILQSKENVLRGSIAIDYYALPKFHQQDEEYFQWDIENTYGKANPFKPFDDIERKEEEINQVDLVDFLISVQPITADIPTIIIGKSKDFEAKTYVYGDNPGIEDVELMVIKEDDRYYYKYKTELGSYPKDYDNSMIEFTPEGRSINLTIASNKRNSNDDINGMNITIINRTDLSLEVNIKNDDPTHSRITYKNLVGDIVIK